ncbi:MAG TPA: FtsL-like putative cell division protein [Bacteroidales bacterium]|nr:FtsL-like putative cell division protein [Bacteroidales bacterium]
MEENQNTDIKEPVDASNKKGRKKNTIGKGILSVLDGTILTKDKTVKSAPFLLYLAFLTILYIFNSYFSEKKNIQIEKMKKELKELRSESIYVKSKLMFNSRQSEINRRIGLYGLKESVKPPIKIVVE